MNVYLTSIANQLEQNNALCVEWVQVLLSSS